MSPLWPMSSVCNLPALPNKVFSVHLVLLFQSPLLTIITKIIIICLSFVGEIGFNLIALTSS